MQSQPLQRLQNQAMRKIAGALKTTSIAALEAELGLPPADLRLDRIQQAYATRLLTLPENHPVLELCPDTFPKTLDNERENGVPGKYTPWYEINPFKPRYESRLKRILSYTNTILQPQSIVEEIDVTADAPWDTYDKIDIQIHPGNKDAAAHNTMTNTSSPTPTPHTYASTLTGHYWMEGQEQGYIPQSPTRPPTSRPTT